MGQWWSGLGRRLSLLGFFHHADKMTSGFTPRNVQNVSYLKAHFLFTYLSVVKQWNQQRRIIQYNKHPTNTSFWTFTKMLLKPSTELLLLLLEQQVSVILPPLSMGTSVRYSNQWALRGSLVHMVFRHSGLPQVLFTDWTPRIWTQQEPISCFGWLISPNWKL